MGSRNVLVGLVVVFCALAVSGCVSTGEITPMGPDQWMVSSHQQGGYPDIGNLQRRNALRAAAFCTSQGKHMTAVSTQEMNNWGFASADTTFLFRCY